MGDFQIGGDIFNKHVCTDGADFVQINCYRLILQE